MWKKEPYKTWETMSNSLIYVYVTESQKRNRKGEEEGNEETRAKNVWFGDIHALKPPKGKQTPSRINTKKTTSRKLIFKLLTNKGGVGWRGWGITA